jgi:hypothetical protein
MSQIVAISAQFAGPGPKPGNRVGMKKLGRRKSERERDGVDE